VQRPVSSSGWNLWRAVVGLAYLAAAGFNTVYTLPRADELDGYADGAWFAFLGDFIRDFWMPNGTPLMILVILFEIAVGLAILSQGRMVDLGVVASLLWVLAVLPFLAWPYLLTNVVLALLQGVLLLRRYDRSIPSLIARFRVDRSAPSDSADESPSHRQRASTKN